MKRTSRTNHKPMLCKDCTKADKASWKCSFNDSINTFPIPSKFTDSKETVGPNWIACKVGRETKNENADRK